MTNIEMIEKLSKKAEVTKEAAEDALKKSNWDILDAMIYLERNAGARNVTAARGYSSANKNEKEEKSSQPEGDNTSKVERYIGKAVAWGLENTLIISKHGSEIIEVPIVFFILILIFSVSFIVVVMILGLFFDFSYSFAGPQLGNEALNSAMKKIYDFVQRIK